MVDVILHVGAHRCATTTFQAYLDRNSIALRARGLRPVTPMQTRDGLFDGFICQPDQEGAALQAGQSRLRTYLQQANAQGVRQVLISEENMIGTPQDNLDRHALYPDIGRRTGRFAEVIGAQVTRIGLAIRSYESYWASLLAFSVFHGRAMPTVDDLAALSAQSHSWSDVVTSLRATFPHAKLLVWRFAEHAERPRRQLALLSGRSDLGAMTTPLLDRKNYSRDTRNLARVLREKGRHADAAELPQQQGRWMPFTKDQGLRMKAVYADDIEAFAKNTDPMIEFSAKAAVKIQRRAPDRTGGHYDRQRQMG